MLGNRLVEALNYGKLHGVIIMKELNAKEMASVSGGWVSVVIAVARYVARSQITRISIFTKTATYRPNLY